MPTIAENLESVERRLRAACDRAGRARADVLLVAVTKQRPLPQVEALHRLGPADFGENRVQEARERIPVLPHGITWHFIGHLQSNKAKYLPGLIQVVHSVDSIELARALSKAWEKHPEIPPLRVLLQFNIAGEEQKHGARGDAALELLGGVLALPRLRVEGLMTMAPFSDDPESARPVFRALRELRDALQSRSGHALSALSMGMTGDFEVAVEEGATHVRIGSALFDDVEP